MEVIDKANESHTRWAPGLVRNPVLQSFASVKYGLSKTEDIYFEKYGYKLLAKQGDVNIYINQLYIPLGFICDKYILSDEFMNLSKLQKGAALLKAVVIPKNMNEVKTSLLHLPLKGIPAEYQTDSLLKDTSERRKQTLKIKFVESA